MRKPKRRARITRMICLRTGLSYSDIDPDHPGVQGIIYKYIFRHLPFFLVGSRDR